MGKECKDCPFKRCNEWRNGGIFWKMAALESIEEAGNIFSCHMKHKDSNVFSSKPMVDNDCGGFAKMLENMKESNKHPEIVNNFLETNPRYDIVGWAKHEGKEFELINRISGKQYQEYLNKKS